jgi:hypothetical protein
MGPGSRKDPHSVNKVIMGKGCRTELIYPAGSLNGAHPGSRRASDG